MAFRKQNPSIIALTLCFCLMAADKADKGPLSPDSFDFKALLGEPPAVDSQAHKDELVEFYKLRNNRTDDDIARAKKEATADAFIFADVLGPWFNAKDLPQTDAMLSYAYKVAKPINKAAKEIYKRHRPDFDPAHPMVQLETDYSFPSGHATRGMMWAIILSEVFPEHKDALIKFGRQFGVDRVIGGEHYPTDVEAGQKLGAEIARRLLDDPKFKTMLDAAEQEVHADAAAPH